MRRMDRYKEDDNQINIWYSEGEPSLIGYPYTDWQNSE